MLLLESDLMEPISCLVVDDELLARQLLSTLVKRDPELSLIGEHSNGGSALTAIREQQPELVLLDIQMPVMTGIELVHHLLDDEHLPYIVFVTAYDQYAIKAFQLNVLDYLVKPIEKDRFAETVRRVKAAIRQRDLCQLTERLMSLVNDKQPAAEAEPPAALTVRKGEQLIYLSHQDIVWAEAANQYVKIHSADGSYLLTRTLSQLSKQVESSEFLRVHRSALVNLRHLDQVIKKTDGSYRLMMSNGSQIRLARNRKDLLPTLLRSSGQNS